MRAIIKAMNDDPSRHVATNPDSEFTLSIDEAWSATRAPDFPALLAASNDIALRVISNAVSSTPASERSI
jgi:hypothetical protein